ncbi:MAG: hypothetical protein ACO38Z_11395, partial [Candidatus Nanopelagicales bacterium]
LLTSMFVMTTKLERVTPVGKEIRVKFPFPLGDALIRDPSLTPALDFYRSIGAEPMDEWTVQRVSGDALRRLAQG